MSFKKKHLFNRKGAFIILKYLKKTNYFLGFLMFACAAANLAIGTRNGEHDT